MFDPYNRATQLKLFGWKTLYTLSIQTPHLPYHICSKIWTSTIYYPSLCLKIAGWVANSVDPDETWHSAASHLSYNKKSDKEVQVYMYLCFFAFNIFLFYSFKRKKK